MKIKKLLMITFVIIVLTTIVYASIELSGTIENKEWEVKYSYHERQIAIYNSNEINVLPVYTEKNDSWSEGYSYVDRRIVGYKIEKIPIKREGIIIDGIDIKDSNIDNGKVHIWDVPVGERNFKEFGRCLDYEIEKGVCKTSNVLEVINEKS